jgi:hypothetical protein
VSIGLEMFQRLEKVPENVNGGRESVAEAKRGQESTNRGCKRTCRKNCFKNSGTHQNVLVLFQSF